MSPFDNVSHGEYFIIESLTRGVFTYFDGDPHFSNSKNRGDAEVDRFATVEQAKKMLARFPESVQKKCKILDARYSFNEVGTTEHKYMVHGHWYAGPGEEGVDRQGYIHFYDIMIATSPEAAKEMAAEDYGDYNYIEVVGIAKDKTQEKSWLAKNPA